MKSFSLFEIFRTFASKLWPTEHRFAGRLRLRRAISRKFKSILRRTFEMKVVQLEDGTAVEITKCTRFTVNGALFREKPQVFSNVEHSNLSNVSAGDTKSEEVADND